MKEISTDSVEMFMIYFNTIFTASNSNGSSFNNFKVKTIHRSRAAAILLSHSIKIHIKTVLQIYKIYYM